ncbi:50S ribosomal protein L35ae [Nanoarchaeota archaeon]
MKGTIVNFRGSYKTTVASNQIVIQPEGSDSKEKAEKLVGKVVVWMTPGNREIKGKISAAHGNSGAVRAICEKGMPGQCVGTKIDIL